MSVFAPGENGDGLLDREPGPTLPPIRYPDIAFEFGILLSESDLDELRTGVTREFPNAIVIARVLQGAGGQATQVGIWLITDADDAARIRGLDRIPRRQSGEIWRYYVSSGLISRTAAEEWRTNELFHHLDHDGHPNRDGPVHLENLFIDYQAPHRIVTTVTGYDEAPAPDVRFRIEIIEDLTTTVDPATGIHRPVVNRQVHFIPNTTVDIVLTALFQALTFLFTIGAAVFFPPLGYLAFFAFLAQLGFGIEAAYINAQNPDLPASGVASMALDRFPRDRLLPNGTKIGFDYHDPDVSVLGISAGATLSFLDRQPSVTIFGPRQLHHMTDQPPRAVPRYRLIKTDLLPDAMARWSGDGTIRPLNPAADDIYVTYDLTGVQAGETLTKHLAVHASDTAGGQADAEITIKIGVGDPSDDTGNGRRPTDDS
jgi:hypothetical protein